MTRYLLTTPIVVILLALTASHAGYSQSQLTTRENPSPQETTTAMVQWRDYIGVLRDLSDSVWKLGEKLGKKDPQLGALIEQMKTDSKFLFDEWKRACCEATPAIYRESLEQDVSLLKSVLDNKINEKEVPQLLQIVEQDLRIKAAHCKNSPKGWDALVVVSVNARKGNEKVEGLEVWFVPKGWAKAQSKWKRFAKVTCGTSETLAPGVYMIWLKGLPPVPIDIGGSGVETKEVDLVVPQ